MGDKIFLYLGKKCPFFGNESALFAWNRSALVSGAIELILKRFYMEISFVFGERSIFHDFLMICLFFTSYNFNF